MLVGVLTMIIGTSWIVVALRIHPLPEVTVGMHTVRARLDAFFHNVKKELAVVQADRANRAQGRANPEKQIPVSGLP